MNDTVPALQQQGAPRLFRPIRHRRHPRLLLRFQELIPARISRWPRGPRLRQNRPLRAILVARGHNRRPMR